MHTRDSPSFLFTLSSATSAHGKNEFLRGGRERSKEGEHGDEEGRKGENEKSVETWGWSSALPTGTGEREDRIGSFLYKRSSVITSWRSPSDFVPRNIQLYNNLKAKAGVGPDRISFLLRPTRRHRFFRTELHLFPRVSLLLRGTPTALPFPEMHETEYANVFGIAQGTYDGKRSCIVIYLS